MKAHRSSRPRPLTLLLNSLAIFVVALAAAGCIIEERRPYYHHAHWHGWHEWRQAGGQDEDALIVVRRRGALRRLHGEFRGCRRPPFSRPAAVAQGPAEA